MQLNHKAEKIKQKTEKADKNKDYKKNKENKKYKTSECKLTECFYGIDVLDK